MSWLDKSNTVAPPGFDRWLVPPAALCIHLCIGMAYGFSVFWLPLTRALGGAAPIACPADLSWFERLYTTACDWDKPLLGWTYTLFFVFLGSSAAVFGGWLEREGPRKAGMVAACCWGGGLAVAALGVYLHQLWLLWLGAGVIGGIGLGIGYISPVSTLVRWFPDRRGLATGLAIMGFGGGAMIGSPLADRLMKAFAGPGDVGVTQTLLVLAGVYTAVMMVGASTYRVPPAGWAVAATRSDPRWVHADDAWRTTTFWFLWLVLCLNVSAGIGVIGVASPMLQEVFGGRLIGVDLPLDGLDAAGREEVAAIAAGFTGLLSLFNIAGRIGWATLSDRLGRPATYAIFFGAGAVVYALVPLTARAGSVAGFVALFAVALSMYGGGFASIPAYLSDRFGTRMVGAIHGRLLTAWSAAGVLGPGLVNGLNELQVARGVPPARAYDTTLWVLAGLLVVGFACNLAVRPVADRWFRPDDAPAATTAAPRVVAGPVRVRTLIFWVVVGAPLAWGVSQTLRTAVRLFG